MLKKTTRFSTKQRKTAGQIPGELIFIGEQKEENVDIEIIAYDDETFIETSIKSTSEILPFINDYKNVWININGLHDIKLISELEHLIGIHTLILEDIVNTAQRPKVDIEDNYIFTIIKMLHLKSDKQTLLSEQVSMYLSKNLLLTFQEKEGDVFDIVRQRLKNKKGRIRSFNTTYLKYSLLDSIVDNYMFIMEVFGEKVEQLEDTILSEPNKSTLLDINKTKLELNFFRKAIKPAKESLITFKNLKNDLINEEEQLFFNDLIDLIHRVNDSLDNYKGMLSEQLTVYSTNVNNRLNDIMKLLTMFSVIFIPITFIAGIYGTNFDNIPELKYTNGYFVMWGVIIFVVITMLSFFKYKKWL